MRRKRILMLIGSMCLALVLAALLLPACAKEAPAPVTGELPEVHWRWQSSYGAGDIWSDVFIPGIIDYIAENTNGKFTGERFFAGEIIPAEEMLTGIGTGLAEAGVAFGGYLAGVEPALDLSVFLPMMGRSPIGDCMAFQNEGPWSEEMRKILAEYGCHYLGWHSYGSFPIFMSKVPIYTLADWKGVKVRTTGYSAELLETMGASTTYMPGSEIVEALAMGVIDCATYSAEGIKEMGFGELMDYLIMPPFMEDYGGFTFVNEKAWKELPYEYKLIVEAANRKFTLESHRFYMEYMEDDINLATGAGTAGTYGYDVIYLPDEDVAEIERLAVEVVWEKWAKISPLCAKGIEIAKEWYGPVFRR